MFALDYDGVIADTNAVKAKWIKDHLGKEVPLYLCDRTSCVPVIGEDQYDRMANEVYEEQLSLEAKPALGVRQSLKILSHYGQIYVISSRSKRQILYAEEWLKRNKLSKFIHSILSKGPKSKVSWAKSLDCKVLIDDDERHLVSEPDNKIVLILLKVGLEPHRLSENDFQLCTDWKDATNHAIRAVIANPM
jgi:uncharacterized HAD superfamily protein